MSSIAQARGARAAVGSRTGARQGAPSRKRTKAAKPRLLSGGVVWIVLFAVLLSGVVAVNVAVLRLNLQRDSVIQDRVQLQADIARLRSELSTAAASARIEADARRRLGLVPADPSNTVYVTLSR